MKSLFCAVATVLCTSTISFAAMALPSSQGSLNGPLQTEVDNMPEGKCWDNPDGSTTCCDACGTGKKCCVTVGPISG